jgi:hypothetical protein
MFSKIFFSENRTLYEIMWKNMADPDMQQKELTVTCFNPYPANVENMVIS